MRTLFPYVFVVSVCAVGLPAFADSITSVAVQTGTLETLSGAGSNVVFTAGSGFDFAATNYLGLATLDSASVTITIDDGDTAPGDFDFDQLTLTLDGIDTGLKLNGFANDTNLMLTIAGPIVNGPSILAALQADGKLVGGITTSLVDDDNTMFFPTIDAALTLNGQPIVAVVPEPGTFAAAAILFGGLALGIVKGRRKN